MQRLSPSIKEEIINQVKKGISLNKITESTKLGKTTVYYYMRKIHGKKYVPVVLSLKDLEIIGEVIGFFAGDGQYVNDKKRWDKRIKFHFNKKEDKVIEYYTNSIGNIINRKPSLLKAKSTTIIQVHMRVFCDFILDYVSFGKRKVQTIELKDKTLLKNKLFVMGFLRGLTDSDGYVRKGRKEIYFGSISKKLFQDYLTGLDYFSFNYKTYVQRGRGYCDFYKVRLSGEEVDKFVSLIKPAKRL